MAQGFVNLPRPRTLSDEEQAAVQSAREGVAKAVRSTYEGVVGFGQKLTEFGKLHSLREPPAVSLGLAEPETVDRFGQVMDVAAFVPLPAVGTLGRMGLRLPIRSKHFSTAEDYLQSRGLASRKPTEMVEGREILGMLEKAPGVSKEEVNFLRIPSELRMTKDRWLNYVKSGRPEVSETVRGHPSAPPIFGNIPKRLPGGHEYKEVYLRFSPIEDILASPAQIGARREAMLAAQTHRIHGVPHDTLAWGVFDIRPTAGGASALVNWENQSDVFQTLRRNTSYWADREKVQEAFKAGGVEAVRETLKKIPSWQRLFPEQHLIAKPTGRGFMSKTVDELSPEAISEAAGGLPIKTARELAAKAGSSDELFDKGRKAFEMGNTDLGLELYRAADMKSMMELEKLPFVKSWHELVLKRGLWEAANDGVDLFAWPTGKSLPWVEGWVKFPEALPQTPPQGTQAIITRLERDYPKFLKKLFKRMGWGEAEIEKVLIPVEGVMVETNAVKLNPHLRSRIKKEATPLFNFTPFPERTKGIIESIINKIESGEDIDSDLADLMDATP